MDKVISTRHIRHDWQTFVDWEQKSVRSLCGVTTKRHLAGIPGITPQPENVQVGGKSVWGWCMGCISEIDKCFGQIESMFPSLHNEVKTLYFNAAKATVWQRKYLEISRKR